MGREIVREADRQTDRGIIEDNHSFTISSLSTYEIEIKYFADILRF